MTRIASLVLLLLAGCNVQKKADVTEVENVVSSYIEYGRIDDQMRWAPTMCAMPSAGSIKMSRADSDATHGRKLFTIYAKDRNVYVSGQKNHVGQVLVKESYEPVKTDAEEHAFGGTEMKRTASTDDGQVWTMGDKLGLFVMIRKEEGWTYATVDAQNKVLEAGAIKVCVDCHQQAPNDSVFGLQ